MFCMIFFFLKIDCSVSICIVHPLSAVSLLTKHPQRFYKEFFLEVNYKEKNPVVLFHTVSTL